ncbi:MAG: filamentous hemagglutinin N-terminal domain-containing protein, partial [Parachlamydiales bacterium]
MKKKSHILFFCAFAPYSLFSNPQGFDLKSGDAVLSTPNPSTLSIHTSNQAIINWESFSISQGEITRFVMPGKESAVLNRVVGGNLSEIYGHLEANGKVFLINPKGIIFGEDAQINAASFFASTLDALDIDFLKGAEIAFCGDSKSSIINMGTISAWDGDVALIAYHIDNQGVLEARHGVAALAAGTNILLSPQGNQRILIRACSIEKNEEAVGINNSGTITALQAELKADGNPYQFAIKDSGHVDALAVEQRGGHIYLVAEGGRLDATGSYNAAHSDGQGGQIHFLANDVYLYDEAVADVSGGSGGGTILIGGDYQGKNPEIPNANVTFVGDTVALKADATDCGNGGKVILWGEEGTGFFGEIFARGGELGGDGGFVEVSSPGHLDFNGIADRSSPQGKDGMLFLDPCNVTISTSGNTGYSYHASTSPTYTFSGSTANINNGTLGSNLNSGPVQIFAGTGYSGTAPSGSITFNPGANVSWSKTNSLDMRCDGGPIQINSVITSTSTGFGSNPVVYMLADSLTIGKSDHSLTADCGISIASGEVQFLGSQTGGFAIYGGTGASSAEGFIKTAGSGCEVDISGVTSISLEAGTSATAGAQGAYIKATSGSSTVSLLVNTGSAGDITITAGAGTGSNDAGIFFTGSATGDVNVSANRAVIITGGSGAPSSAGIQATGKMTVYGYGNGGATPDIIVQGGTTANTPAFIELINSSSKMNLAGWSYGISILGGSGSNSPAYITATGSSPIPIGGGSVTLAGGTGSNSPAYLSTNSGSITTLAQQIEFGGGFSLTGGSGSGSPAYITSTSGSINLNTAGSYPITLTGGNTGSGSGAYISTASAASTLTLASSTISLTGGDAASCAAEIYTAGTNLTLDLIRSTDSGSISLHGGAGDSSYAEIYTSGATTAAGTTRIAIGQTNAINGISLIGGSGPTKSSAKIATRTGGDILCTSKSSYTITGGTGSSESLAGIYTGVTSGSGNLNVTGTSYTLKGGDVGGTGNNRAEISTVNGGSIGLNSTSGTVTLQGYNAQTSDARIITQVGTSPITITTKGALSLLGGTGAQAAAEVATVAGGDITSTITGNYTITGGTGSTDSRAGFYAGFTSGSGGVSLSGAGYSLTGGLSGTGTNSAEILAATAGGSISLTSNGSPLTLLAQGATASDARIAVQSSGTMMINNISTFSATGGSGTTARAIVATNQGGSITITGSGNYTIAGGTSANNSYAGIYAGLSSGSGSVTLSGGGYSLTGGLSGTGTNSAEILASGAGGLISLTSNGSPLTLLARGATASDARIATQGSGDITIHNISTFSATGGAGDTARAIVATNQGGSITIIGTGDHTMTGGTSGTESRAGIYAGLTSGSGGISMAGNSYTLTGGAMGAGFNRAEISSSGGDINLTASLGPSKLQGGGGSNTATRIVANTSGSISFNAGGAVSLLGSTTATGTNALASMTTANGNIALSALGLLTLQGGGYSGTSAQIATGSAANTITAQSIGITLQGGTAAGAFAEISTVGGAISIDGTTNGAGSISLAGNTADSTYAQIITTGTPQAANMIQIGQMPGAGIVHPTSITLAGSSGTTSSRAIIATDTGGNILSTITGNYTFTGGQTNGAASDDGRAGIYAGLSSGSGGITLAGNSFTLTGGPLGIGINRAEIISSGGDINLTASTGPNKLQGGGGTNTAA